MHLPNGLLLIAAMFHVRAFRVLPALRTSTSDLVGVFAVKIDMKPRINMIPTVHRTKVGDISVLEYVFESFAIKDAIYEEGQVL